MAVLVLSACGTMDIKPGHGPVEEPVVADKSKEIIEDESCNCPELEVASEKECPVIAAVPIKAEQESARQPLRIHNLLVIGRVEKVMLKPNNLLIKARVDTGAGITSLNALELSNFERDGKRWVRFAVLDPETDEKIFFERRVQRTTCIKQLSGDYQSRPVVNMTLELGPLEEQIEVTLQDRTGYLYQLLIGRNFLRDRAIVDVSQSYATKTVKVVPEDDKKQR